MNKPVTSLSSSTKDRPGNNDTQAPLLRVYTVGAFHLDWQVPPWTTDDLWKSRTAARALLKLLVCAPGRQASRSQLAGILWPETDEDKARESLRSASKVLCKVLRTESGVDLLENRNNHAILALAQQARLWVDADAFEDLTAQAIRVKVPEEALALWKEAQALLRGEFLADDQDSEWIRHRWVKLRQQALRMARGRMVRHLADLLLQQGQLSLAEEMLEEHLIRFPTNQDVLYRLLVLLEQQGCFEEACLLYERTKRTLEALGKQPAQHVRTRYEHLRASLTFPHAEVSLLKRAPERERSPHPAVSPAAFPQLARAGLESSDQKLVRHSSNVPSPHALEEGSDALWEILRILLEPAQTGRADLPLFSRRQFLELGITALISHLAQLDGARVSVIEREALSRALSESIIDGWKHLLLWDNAQVVALGRAQLASIHQAHTLVNPSALPYLYAGAHHFLGLGLHFQERDEEALQEYHHGYLASLATGDRWYVAQSLICQADSYHALGQYHAALQAIQEALRVIAHTSDEDGTIRRARAHLLSCWADTAMMLGDERTTQEKLEQAEASLDPGVPDKEFDRSAWLLIAGKYALRMNQDETARARFAEALLALPQAWLLRRVMSATGLAMACARLGDREASVALTQELIPLIHRTNAPLTNRWFTDYLHQDLLGRFPADNNIQGLVVETCQQLPPSTSRLPAGT